MHVPSSGQKLKESPNTQEYDEHTYRFII